MLVKKGLSLGTYMRQRGYALPKLLPASHENKRTDYINSASNVPHFY